MSTKRIKFKWKDEYNSQWYKDHLADTYLSCDSKLSILEEYILSIDDKDSEATFDVVENNDL